MLQNVNDIVKRVGALLDDPANTRFDAPYLIPHIDQHFDEMDVELEKLGMQYIQHITAVPIAANVTDLTYLLADGQALATMKVPTRLDWKQSGQPDTSYLRSAYVDELDDVGPNSVGALQWTFQQGAIFITPSTTALVARIYFDAVSTDLYDASQNVIRGTAHILAARVAAYVASLNNGMGALQVKLEKKSAKVWNDFASVVNMKNQAKQRGPRPMHRRIFPTGMPQQSSQQ